MAKSFRSALLALALIPATLTAGAAVAGCGGKDKDAKSAADVAAALDADPLALLPGTVVALVTVDAKAFYASASAGTQLAQLTEQLLPIGQEAGFVPSRDVDRVLLGVYSTQGADVAAVLRGRFDVARLETMARQGTPTRAGVPIVASPYGGRTLYTVNNVGFVPLSGETVLCGTETGLRRALDRLRDGKAPPREFAPWIVQVVETPGASVAAAADLQNQQAAAAAFANLPLPWLRGITAARVVGTFIPTGLQVAGSLTYADPQAAAAGANGLKGVVTLANIAAATGFAPRIQNLQVNVVQTDVQYSAQTDEQSLKAFLGNLPKLLGR